MANPLEKRVKSFLETEGGYDKVLSSGWPDFLCLRRDKTGKLHLLAVEVKGEKDTVRPNQEAVLDALAEAGVKVYLIKERPQYHNEQGGFLTVDWRERSGL